MPSPLYSYTGQRALVRADGSTLNALFEDLDARFPGLRFRVIDEQGALRRHMRVFVNGEETSRLSTRLRSTDEVHIIAALSGG